jgi:hypothetical protein
MHGRDRQLRGGGWLEAPGEADLWGPHVRGVLIHAEDAYAYSGFDSGLRHLKYVESSKNKIDEEL